MGARDPETSETLLRFLLDIGTRGPTGFDAPYSLIAPGVFAAIAAKMGPFFHLAHPTKGAVEGPWAKVPTSTQRLALDVARVWTQFDESGRLAGAVTRAVQGTWAEAHWSSRA